MVREICEALVRGDLSDPSFFLGMHRESETVVVRVFRPFAESVTVLSRDGRKRYPTERIHPGGVFVARTEERETFPYLLEIVEDDQTFVIPDPYAFPPLLTDFDLHLFNEGTHARVYEKLGAHVVVLEGFPGVHFAVWAPNAFRVSVVGDFNRWDGRVHLLRPRGSSGVWEIFVPGIGEGEKYKFEIKTKEGHLLLKADPYAFFSEVRPKTASIVFDLSGFPWQDAEWMERRKTVDLLSSPMNIYEVHLGSWKRKPDGSFLSYREVAEELIPYVKDMGYTHIELLPLAEHPFDGSWGYHVTGYFAPTSRFGTPKDFMAFVDLCHREGVGVILDWVIAHFPKDAHGLGRFDGTGLYEHLDPKKGEHPHWGSYIFNYGRCEVRSFLLSNAFFWFEKFHIDALRVDAVASMLYLDYGRKEGEWIPNRFGGKENLEAIDFLRFLHERVYTAFPGIATIAEESTAWPGVTLPPYAGGLGFLFKWNMGWMNDILLYMSKDPIYRKYHHTNLTFPIWYAFSENFILPLSHDEVVHGKRSLLEKMPGDDWQKFANLRLLFGLMFGYPGKKLLFMGGEFGQRQEWNHDRALDWFLLDDEPHRKLHRYVRDLNHLYLRERALWECDAKPEGFEWIDCHDAENSVIAFLRKSKDPNDFLVFVLNFTPVPRFAYRVGIPRPGFYEEILNSDSAFYYGSNLGNLGGVWAEEVPAHGRPYSLSLTLPPLSCCIFKWRGV
uniref:1,4-alpha-glucan branching enzyme GlgB n=1 Tax=Candidatus Caldatribacterium californiense TaxID=1454726 RepID=A0A7V3YHG5_9BACT